MGVKWRIGDECEIPYTSPRLGIGGWHRGVIVALRGETALVEAYGVTYERPRYELRAVVHRRAFPSMGARRGKR
jgi:hypothetical protein